jgi:hypothetical protein
MDRQDLIKELQEEFNRTYPFLKIEFSKRKGLSQEEKRSAANGGLSPEGKNIHSAAQKLLWDEFGLSDDMKVSELETVLQYQFGLPVQILRKSGNLWIETRMTRHWTLRQQNDHGEDITSGL